MRAFPPLADPFQHPHKVRYSHAEVYRRGYSMSVGQKTDGTAHKFADRPTTPLSEGDRQLWIDDDTLDSSRRPRTVPTSPHASARAS
jgi:hypothetical protein